MDRSGPSPARGSSIRWSSHASATSSWSRARSSTASSTACTARRTSARRWISPSTAATCRATTSAASTGGCTPGPTGTTSRSTRRTPTPTSRCCSTCRSRWGSAAAASPSSTTRKMLAGCLTYLVHRQRDRVGLVAFDSDIVEHVPPSAKHMDVVLHVLDRLKPPARAAAPPLHKMAEHFGRRGSARADLGSLRGAGRRDRGGRAAAVPRQRPGRVPRARSGRDRFLVRRAVGVRGSGERRADPDRARGAGASSTARSSARTSTALTRALPEQPHRLHAAEHVDAARSRAVQLPVDARATDRGCGSRVVSHPALPPRTRRARHSGADPPDSARAEERRRVSVADVPARIPYQSVRRRRIRDWLLLLHAAGGAGAHRRWRSRGRSSGGPSLRRRPSDGAREVVILLDRSYSMGYGDTLGAGPRASARCDRPDAGRSRVAGALSSRRRGGGAFGGGSRPARGRARRRCSRRGRDALRPGAEAGRQHPERVALPRREVILISDFQRRGWQAARACDCRTGRR